jgi:ArsR family metal-binding transcriptional regulator
MTTEPLKWFIMTLEPFRYEFKLSESQIIINAMHTQDYFEWELTVDVKIPHELYTPEIIFELFYDYYRDQTHDDTKIIFPDSYEKCDKAISITFLNKIRWNRFQTNHTAILILIPKEIELEKIMTAIYNHGYFKFKKELLDKISKITLYDKSSDIYNDVHIQFQKDLINNLKKVPLDCAIDYAVECAVSIHENHNFNEIFQIIKWFVDKSKYGIHMMDYAAADGHLKMIKWLHQNICPVTNCRDNEKECCTVNAMDYASRGGHLEVIKWLHENRKEGCTMSAMIMASYNGHLETVKWLHENRKEGSNHDAMNWAAQNGHLEVIKYLHRNRNEGCTKYAMNYASLNGHLEVVKWLHENRKEGCTTTAMLYASTNGHIELVKWLYLNRKEMSLDYTITTVSLHGHLDLIKWLEETKKL